MSTLSVGHRGEVAQLQQLALKSLDALPPFSPVLNRLLATLADEDVPFSRLAALIEKDTVLAGNVLRVVNSAAFSCRGTVNSVVHAIAIMGLNKLRNTALGCSVTRLWRGVKGANGWSMADFNLHSIAVAILADEIAQRVDVHYPEGAFAAGLFHDLGKLMIAVGLPVEYEAIHAGAGNQECESEGRERELLGVTHADLSAMALERWNLPRPIQVAVAFHHDPESAPPDTRGICRFSLADVLMGADRIANELGVQAIRRDQPVEPNPTAALDRLDATRHCESVLTDFNAEYEMVKSLF